MITIRKIFVVACFVVFVGVIIMVKISEPDPP